MWKCKRGESSLWGSLAEYGDRGKDQRTKDRSVQDFHLNNREERTEFQGTMRKITVLYIKKIEMIRKHLKK